MATAGVAFVVVEFARHRWGLVVTRIELGSGKNGVILERQTGNRGEYTLVVSAQGWQPTAIEVAQGDELTFEASGSVQVSVRDIYDVATRRARIDSLVIVTRRLRPDTGDVRVPESYYTAAQDSMVALPRPWLGPDGDTRPGRLVDHRYPGRTRYKVLPLAPYGALVGAVSSASSGSRPDSTRVFLVGASRTMVAPAPGYLWFTVNDVFWPDGRFFYDNIGYFLVRVSVTRKR